MKTLQVLFFSLILLHFKWYSRLSFCHTGLCTERSMKEKHLAGYLDSNPIASFVEQFKGDHENIKSVISESHVSKLDQKNILSFPIALVA